MNYLDKTQKDFITEIKQKIRQAQYEAMKTVNVQLINLYTAPFYNEYHAVENLVPLVREISWSKNIVIMNKCKDNFDWK